MSAQQILLKLQIFSVNDYVQAFELLIIKKSLFQDTANSQANHGTEVQGREAER